MGPPPAESLVRAPAVARRGPLARWWWDLPLRYKALLIFMVPALMMGVPVALALAINHDQNQVRDEGRDLRAGQDKLLPLAAALVPAESSLLRFFLTGDTAVLEGLDALPETVEQQLSALGDGAPARLTAILEELDGAIDRYFDYLDRVTEPAESGTITPGSDAIPELVEEQATLIDEVRIELIRVAAFFLEENARMREELDDNSRRIVTVLVIGIAVCLAGALIGLWLFVRSMVSRIGELRDAAAMIISGEDVAAVAELPPSSRADEIGYLVNELRSAAVILIHANSEIAESRDMALAATKAKDEFLSRMSHELRTPLSAILGFGQLMQMEENLSPDDKEAVDQIVKAGRHLLALINDLLDISRIASGHLALSLERVDVADAVSAVVDLMRPIAADRGITVTSHIPPGTAVTADHQRLKQVMLNLVSNAIKYNSQSGSVQLRAEQVDDQVRVNITDSGPGISRAGQERLFQPFERLEATSTTEGTGVGLALSKSLVDAMDGSIGVDSIVGRGSTFWVQLPGTIEPAAMEPAQPELTSDAASNVAPNGEGRTVLYVEDNVANVRVMERFMRERGLHLETAMHGGLAVDLARELLPWVILLDLHLPDTDGAAVLQILKGDPITAGIPVVILSADTSQRGVDRLLELGALDYLTKPVDIHELSLLLNRIERPPDAASRPKDS